MVGVTPVCVMYGVNSTVVSAAATSTTKRVSGPL